jgi:hypothetical protein
MKLMRIAFFLLIVGLFSSLALMAEKEASVATKMSDAASEFLTSLSPELKKKVSFSFDDDHRVNWFFTPQQDKQRSYTRKGVPFEELSEAQQKAALELLKTGTSKKGYEQAVTIMSLESILKDLEKKGAMVRNPGWYFVSIFGEPSKTGTWGWRIEGHHLSVNFTVDKGQVSSVTPFFFGANPAVVKGGDRKGLQTLPEVETHARELIDSLVDEQKKVAKQDLKQLPEIAEKTTKASPGEPIGLVASKLTANQQATLLKLLQAYTDRMPDAIGATELENVKKTSMEKIYFAYTGETQPGKPYTYRVHGPSFLVEFLNVQADSAGNPANHIHSVWRHIPADFGLKQ